MMQKIAKEKADRPDILIFQGCCRVLFTHQVLISASFLWQGARSEPLKTCLIIMVIAFACLSGNLIVPIFLRGDLRTGKRTKECERSN